MGLVAFGDLSSWTRVQTHIPCISRQVLNHWTTRKVLSCITSSHVGNFSKLNSHTTTTWKESVHWKRPWCGEGLRAGAEVGDRGWDDMVASSTQWRWVWVNSRRHWKTRKPGVLQSEELKRIHMAEWTAAAITFADTNQWNISPVHITAFLYSDSINR